MAPSEEVWNNIQTRINPVTRTASSSSGWLPTFWRFWAIAATLVLAVIVALPTTFQQTPAQYVVVITHDVDATAGWLVSLKQGGERVQVEALSQHQIPSDRVFQLWVKSPLRTRVESVGLIAASGEIEIEAGSELQSLLGSAVLFGVSVEPPGGSPTGQPTTKPLFHGKPKAI